jgi:hypothetical protein
MVEHMDSAHDPPGAERHRLPDQPPAAGEDAGHAAAWAEVIERRVAELRSGNVKPIPGEQVLDELEDLLP